MRAPRRADAMKRGRKRRVLTAVIACAIAGALAFGGVLAAVCVSAGRQYPAQRADCVVVLGARVWPDGALSSTLLHRCESALEAWRAGLAPAMILCGGQGRGEPVAEAEAMRRWMLGQGVPEGALYVEDASRNTAQNLRNARAIMRANGFETAAVCTSDYHLRRALWIARDAGIDAVGIAAAPPDRMRSRVLGRLRETCSWMLYWVRRIGR